jgi:hypothetical protein
MPKADTTELAPKKSAVETLRYNSICIGGFLVLPVPFRGLKINPISLVRLPSGGLGQ